MIVRLTSHSNKIVEKEACLRLAFDAALDKSLDRTCNRNSDN